MRLRLISGWAKVMLEWRCRKCVSSSRAEKDLSSLAPVSGGKFASTHRVWGKAITKGLTIVRKGGRYVPIRDEKPALPSIGRDGKSRVRDVGRDSACAKLPHGQQSCDQAGTPIAKYGPSTR